MGACTSNPIPSTTPVDDNHTHIRQESNIDPAVQVKIIKQPERSHAVQHPSVTTSSLASKLSGLPIVSDLPTISASESRIPPPGIVAEDGVDLEFPSPLPSPITTARPSAMSVSSGPSKSVHTRPASTSSVSSASVSPAITAYTSTSLPLPHPSRPQAVIIPSLRITDGSTSPITMRDGQSSPATMRSARFHSDNETSTSPRANDTTSTQPISQRTTTPTPTSRDTNTATPRHVKPASPRGSDSQGMNSLSSPSIPNDRNSSILSITSNGSMDEMDEEDGYDTDEEMPTLADDLPLDQLRLEYARARHDLISIRRAYKRALTTVEQHKKELEEVKHARLQSATDIINQSIRVLANSTASHEDDHIKQQLMDLLIHFAETELNTPSEPLPFSSVIRRSQLDDMTKNWLTAEFTRDDVTRSGVGATDATPAGRQRVVSLDVSMYGANGISDKNQQPRDSLPATLPSSHPLTNGTPPPLISSTSLPISLSSDHMYITSRIDMTAMDSWSFDVTELPMDVLPLYVSRMLLGFDLLKRFSIPTETCNNFIHAVSQAYIHTNDYHNFYHAVDVLHCVYLYLKKTDVIRQARLRSLDLLGLLLSAVCHDIGHNGLNNAYHCNTGSELALLYNDQSVLEHFHCATLFKILNRSECNILGSLTKRDRQETRKVIISCILATDMTHHFDMVSRLDGLFDRLERASEADLAAEEQSKRKDSDPDTDLDSSRRTIAISREDVLQLLNVLLHSADLSNASKPWKIAKKWSDRISEEMMKQGDIERSLNLNISPYMDRLNPNQAQMSLNFIDFIVAPLVASLVQAFPSLVTTAHHLIKNRRRWNEICMSQLESSITSCTDSTQKLTKENERRTLLARGRRFKATFILPTKSQPTPSTSTPRTLPSTSTPRDTITPQLNRMGSQPIQQQPKHHHVKNRLSATVKVRPRRLDSRGRSVTSPDDPNPSVTAAIVKGIVETDEIVENDDVDIDVDGDGDGDGEEGDQVDTTSNVTSPISTTSDIDAITTPTRVASPSSPKDTISPTPTDTLSPLRSRSPTVSPLTIPASTDRTHLPRRYQRHSRRYSVGIARKMMMLIDDTSFDIPITSKKYSTLSPKNARSTNGTPPSSASSMSPTHPFATMVSPKHAKGSGSNRRRSSSLDQGISQHLHLHAAPAQNSIALSPLIVPGLSPRIAPTFHDSPTSPTANGTRNT